MFYKLLTAFIATLVVVLISFGIGRTVLNSDRSGKPSRQELLEEIARLQPQSNVGKLRYVNKISTIYVVGNSGMGIRPIFGVDPITAGWSFKSRRRYEDGEVVRYCRGRLALSIDTNVSATSVDFGIYWASDRGSGFYCAKKIP